MQEIQTEGDRATEWRRQKCEKARTIPQEEVQEVALCVLSRYMYWSLGEEKGLPERDFDTHKADHLLEGGSTPNWRKYRLADLEDDHSGTQAQNPDPQYDAAAEITCKKEISFASFKT
jgi:hypothetical protein